MEKNFSFQNVDDANRELPNEEGTFQLYEHLAESKEHGIKPGEIYFAETEKSCKNQTSKASVGKSLFPASSSYCLKCRQLQ